VDLVVLPRNLLDLRETHHQDLGKVPRMGILRIVNLLRGCNASVVSNVMHLDILHLLALLRHPRKLLAMVQVKATTPIKLKDLILLRDREGVSIVIALIMFLLSVNRRSLVHSTKETPDESVFCLLIAIKSHVYLLMIVLR
jgi:hypothetical protein